MITVQRRHIGASVEKLTGAKSEERRTEEQKGCLRPDKNSENNHVSSSKRCHFIHQQEKHRRKSDLTTITSISESLLRTLCGYF